MVWKFRSASRRPWEISGWYGVYAVYHAGLSSTLRRITGGVIVSEYPIPIRETSGRFRAASSSSSASASRSVQASGSARGASSRIVAGTVAATSWSSEPSPNVASIAACSSASGPRWRDANASVSEPRLERCGSGLGISGLGISGLGISGLGISGRGHLGAGHRVSWRQLAGTAVVGPSSPAVA